METEIRLLGGSFIPCSILAETQSPVGLARPCTTMRTHTIGLQNTGMDSRVQEVMDSTIRPLLDSRIHYGIGHDRRQSATRFTSDRSG